MQGGKQSWKQTKIFIGDPEGSVATNKRILVWFFTICVLLEPSKESSL
jgi:hypothetical protein